MKKYLNLLIIILAFFTINVNAATEKINIKEVKIIDKSATIVAENPVLENNIISSNINFNKVGDYVVYELTLENKDDCDYTIENVFDNNEISNLTIEYDYDEKLLQNKTAKLRVTLTYLTGLPDSNNVALNNLEIKMNLLKPDGTTTEVKITNPNTGDNILLYVAILFISLIGMILVIKKHKIGQLLMLFAIVILPLSIYAADTFEIKFVISNVLLKSDKLPTKLGAPVENFGGYNWHVIKSDETSVTLLMDAGANGSDLLPNLTNGQMVHCRPLTDPNSTNCTPVVGYITAANQTLHNTSSYSWEKSQVNSYLNDESEGSFLSTLRTQIDKEIIPARVCNDYTQASSNTDYLNGRRLISHPGYLESEISDGSCANNMGSYNVRLITYNELSSLNGNIMVEGVREWLDVDNTSTMTAFLSNFDDLNTIWISYNGSTYYGSSTYEKLIRPVITIAQNNVFKEEDKQNEVKMIINEYLKRAKNEKKNLSASRAINVIDINAGFTNSPKEGWVSFAVTDEGIIVNDYSLKVFNYIADYSSTESDNIVLTKDGTLRTKPKTDYVVDGVKYYDGASTAYFDPTGTDLTCSSTHYNTSGKTGCMKWWVYSEFDDNGTTYVNMMLDHNTTQRVKWYNSGSSLENGGTNSHGPLTLLAQLKSDTSNWNALSNRTDSYIVKLGPMPMSNEYQNIYTINYSTYKARLLTAEEYNAIVQYGLKKDNPISSWLISNTATDGNPALGYWTSSIYSYSSNVAYGIINGKSTGGDFSESNKLGVRPVITLPKSVVNME